MPRLFRNHPGYVVLATVVLAVSIGVNLLVFTVVNALWIRLLPFPEPHRVVTVLQEHMGFLTLDLPQLRIFEGGVAGQVITTDDSEGLRPRIEIPGAGEVAETLGVTSGYFKVLGLQIRGRDFTAEDEPAGAEPVAIISDRLWTTAFEGRADVVGSVLPSQPVPIKVIGVAPRGFHGARRGERADLWIPIGLLQRLAPDDWKDKSLAMMVFGRLGPSQTAAAAERAYRDLMDPRQREMMLRLLRHPLFPDVARVVPLSDVFGTPESRTFLIREGNALLVVFGLTLLVLVGGCATIAALVLVHYEQRRGELALKMTLGAGRRRLMFELLRDLGLVAAAGSAGGLLVATVGTGVIPALSLPGGVNVGRLDLSIDWRVCAVAIAATVVTLLLAAALPIVRATGARLAGELLVGLSAATLGSMRARQALLSLQVCSTIVVLVAAGLFVSAVAHGFGGAAGFDVDRTVFVSIQETAPFYSGGGDPRPLIAQRAARLMPILAGLPGVREVAEGIPPLDLYLAASLDRPQTIEVKDGAHQLRVGLLQGSPNLLSALGVPILAGRALTAEDVNPPPHPAVISSSLALRLFPQGGALGETLSMSQGRGSRYVVVGIAGNLPVGSLTRGGDAIVTAGIGNSLIVSHFVLNTEHPEMVAAAVERTIAGQVVRAETGREIVARDIGRQRLGAWFFSGFGLAALLLGVGGAFGLVAYLAESRKREFGVRLALGATMRDLVRQGLVAALAPVSVGVAVGLAVGAIVSRLFSALLVGVSPMDVVTYVVVAMMMLGCAAMAALAAAWRLRRTSPSDALRAT